jgi:ABC-2 type transport system permease protein
VSVRRLWAQTGMELRLLLRNGENLLVTLGIPIGILTFFSLVDVLPTDGRPAVEFLAPGVLALAVMGAAMVSLGIATGFERHYLVLKRLGATPLTRTELVAAKALSVLAIELVQVIVVLGVAAALGWRPDAGTAGVAAGVLAVLLGTAAFAGIGLAMAGSLRAVGTLALVNALFLLLMLLGGMVFSLDVLPDAVAAVARLLPSAALSDALRSALGESEVLLRPLAVLTAWAAAAIALAASLFRWE